MCVLVYFAEEGGWQGEYGRMLRNIKKYMYKNQQKIMEMYKRRELSEELRGSRCKENDNR